MIIAIDGTLASGKGTIARQLAGWYGLAYLDTGQLYRAVGVAALKRSTDFDDPHALAEIAAGLDLNGFDEDELRTSQAGQAASRVAAVPEVRTALLQFQREFAFRAGGAVLDGRDIGTVVCPQADVKLWVDATVEVRARRRWQELRTKGESLTFDQMLSELRERDTRDATREDAPMRAAEDAVLIDTTDLSIDAAVDKARAAVETFLACNS